MCVSVVVVEVAGVAGVVVVVVLVVGCGVAQPVSDTKTAAAKQERINFVISIILVWLVALQSQLALSVGQRPWGVTLTIRLFFQAAKSAREIHDHANQQNQTQAAPADGGTAEVKAAAAEQEEQHHHEQ
jgi:Mg2+/Co2+ transporter CorB